MVRSWNSALKAKDCLGGFSPWYGSQVRKRTFIEAEETLDPTPSAH